MAMIANPIFINTFVVFVRLYWFEKRFQHIVREARNIRKSRSRSRTVTHALHDDLPKKEERGVNGRSIVVLHGGGRKLDGETRGILNEKNPDKEEGESSLSSSSDIHKKDTDSNDPSDGSSSPHAASRRPSFHRDITFADELNPRAGVGSQVERVPQQMSAEQQIAFLENQRNPKDKGTLRIPGPRETERGVTPETLLDGDHGNLDEQVVSPIETHDYLNGVTGTLEIGGPNEDDHPMKRNITIDDSNHPHWNKVRPSLSNVTFRNAATNRSKRTSTFDKAPSTARPRSRAGTFGSFRNSSEKDRGDSLPYLSWQPTIGRNSAFVDLTEDQREELGGIEYRSLKTLAIILVCKWPLDERFIVHIDNENSLLPLLSSPRSGRSGSVDCANRYVGVCCGQ